MSKDSATGGLAAALRPAWAVIDLDALVHNVEHLRKRVAPSGLFAVVKADAYGHGAVPVARCLEDSGVDWLGVALLEEGVEIRRHGVRTPILVLGTARPAQFPLYTSYSLTPTVSSRDQLALWSSFAKDKTEPQNIHLKVDVGMHRLGIEPDLLAESLDEVRRHPGLELSGLLSHLAEADNLESSRTSEQEKRFVELLELLKDNERSNIHLHLANSAAALHHPRARFSFVRTGLALLGLDPARREKELRPVMSVKSRLIQIRQVPAGAQPGYGATWTASRPTRLGVVPVGYADGYSWRLSNKAHMLVGGRKAPVVGAVSMDLTLIDLTDIPADIGGEVVLLGRQGELEITTFDLARWADSIPYEVLCLFGLRLPHRFLRGGTETKVESRFSR